MIESSAIALRVGSHVATGDYRVPSHLDEEGLESLHALAFVRQGSEWATAAAVYAWTEPGEGHFASGKNLPDDGKLTITDFASIGLRGLTSRPTVRKYRQAWQTAVDNGWAEEAEPGGTVRLPEVDFDSAVAADNHRALGTGENEWYTPPQYLEMAREVMGGIDLDPASSDLAQEMVLAERYYTKEDDGLARDIANGRGTAA